MTLIDNVLNIKILYDGRMSTRAKPRAGTHNTLHIPSVKQLCYVSV